MARSLFNTGDLVASPRRAVVFYLVPKATSFVLSSPVRKAVFVDL
jgi:hypothetical protein